MLNKLFKIGCLTALIIFLAAMPAWALPFGFDGILTEDSNPDDIALGVDQLSFEVINNKNGTVSFKFDNADQEAMFIAGVHFDDDAGLLGDFVSDASTSTDDVSFIQPTNKKGEVVVKELPGANELDSEFETDYYFQAETLGSGAQGVDQGEELILTFDFLGENFGALIAALADGTLKIGISVQGFDSEGSESFIASVPEPSTLLLFGTGLVGLAGLRRKKLLKK